MAKTTNGEYKGRITKTMKMKTTNGDYKGLITKTMKMKPIEKKYEGSSAKPSGKPGAGLKRKK